MSEQRYKSGHLMFSVLNVKVWSVCTHCFNDGGMEI